MDRFRASLRGHQFFLYLKAIPHTIHQLTWITVPAFTQLRGTGKESLQCLSSVPARYFATQCICFSWTMNLFTRRRFLSALAANFTLPGVRRALSACLGGPFATTPLQIGAVKPVAPKPELDPAQAKKGSFWFNDVAGRSSFTYRRTPSIEHSLPFVMS